MSRLSISVACGPTVMAVFIFATYSMKEDVFYRYNIHECLLHNYFDNLYNPSTYKLNVIGLWLYTPFT